MYELARRSGRARGRTGGTRPPGTGLVGRARHIRFARSRTGSVLGRSRLATHTTVHRAHGRCAALSVPRTPVRSPYAPGVEQLQPRTMTGELIHVCAEPVRQGLALVDLP